MNQCFLHESTIEYSSIIILSTLAYFITLKTISSSKEIFVRAGFSGKDLNKIGTPIIPEAQGVICGCVFLLTMYTFLPFPFINYLKHKNSLLGYFLSSVCYNENHPENAIHQFGRYLAGLQSVCCMILMGFADDALDLKWKHKMPLPLFASLPLLMVHFSIVGNTFIVVPLPLRGLFGRAIDIGIFYYFYMGLLSIFCTHAINIYAGVNGLEAGQGLVLAISVVIHNLIELNGITGHYHKFSLFFLIPFIAVSLALLKMNWTPAQVFVGDTYCYFTGMILAVVGILGHFSKTLLLFFLPQILNFILSIPQLFKFLPCPRHRLPSLDQQTGLLNPSYFEMEMVLVKKSSILKIILTVLKFSGLILHQNDKTVKIANLTLINLNLCWMGPCEESNLSKRLIFSQIICSIFAFIIRYPIARLFYEI